MEFEEMKKIWDNQTNQPMYAIDQDALQQRVSKRKNKAKNIASYTEKALAGALGLSGLAIVAVNVFTGKYEVTSLIMAVLMLAMATYVMVNRSKRLKWNNTFDNSILGELEEAIAHANYQVRLSQSGRWFFFIVAGFTVLSTYSTTADIPKTIIVIAFFVVVYFLAKWEHKTFYVSQKQRLLDMKKKLQELEVV